MKTFTKTLSFILLICFAFCTTACGAKHAGDIADNNDDWNILDWDDITSSAYDETDYYEDIVTDLCLFDMNVKDLTVVEVATVEQKDVTDYFDEDKIYNTFGMRLDVNKLLTKFAIGTGVIVLCLSFSAITAGLGVQPVLCIATGALNGAIGGAATGTIMGGIIGGITNYLASDGDFSEAMVGAVEGAVDGYMWGAVCGAIQGAVTSNYCFTAGTQIKTPNGYIPIQDIEVGDEVWSMNAFTGKSEVKTVTATFENHSNELVTVTAGDCKVEATPSHPFYVNGRYCEIGSAKAGDDLLSFNGQLVTIEEIERYSPAEEVTVYNFEVEDNHNYFVGSGEVLVHNTCINEKYADQRYHFESQLKAAQDTNDPAAWKTYQDLIAKYPDGVPFVRTQNGVFPDFEEYTILKYEFPPVTPENLKAGTCLQGISDASSPDFKLFRERMLQDSYTKDQIRELLSVNTIHHHYDTRTLELIPRDLHQAARHTGGASLIREIIAALI